MLFGTENEQRNEHIIDIPRVYNVINARRRNNPQFNGLGLRTQIKIAIASIYGAGAATTVALSYAYNKISNYYESTPERKPGKKTLSQPPFTPSDKRKKSSFPNLRNTEDMKRDFEEMEDVEKGEMEIAKASAEAGGGKRGSHETPIMKVPPTLGFPETHTTILPSEIYLSAVLKQNESLDLKIIMNSVISLFNSTILDAPANPVATIGEQFTKGFYNQKIPLADDLIGNGTTATSYSIGERPNFSRWTVTKYNFPNKETAGGSPAPQWRAYWQKQYEKYSVLKCDYEIEHEICNLKEASDVLVMQGTDTFSATATGQVFPSSTTILNARHWPNTKWTLFRSTGAYDQGDRFFTIKGTHYPGMGQRLVTNDEDVKTWTTLGSSPAIPDLREQLHIKYWPAPFNNNQERKVPVITISSTDYTNVPMTLMNLKISLRQEVQFKDLVRTFRYPLAADTAISQTVPTDLNMFNGTAVIP